MWDINNKNEPFCVCAHALTVCKMIRCGYRWIFQKLSTNWNWFLSDQTLLWEREYEMREKKICREIYMWVDKRFIFFIWVGFINASGCSVRQTSAQISIPSILIGWMEINSELDWLKIHQVLINTPFINERIIVERYRVKENKKWGIKGYLNLFKRCNYNHYRAIWVPPNIYWTLLFDSRNISIKI